VWQYPFDPLPKQREAMIADVDEVLYGGSLGSGKSEVLLAACVTLCTMVPGAKALLLRRSFPELNELVERLKERVPKEVAGYNKSDHIFNFGNGSQLILGYLDGEDDHERYQGFELQLVCFDELTHYRRKAYTMLLTRLRASGKVAATMARYGFKLRALAASNPGSRGHAWVKERFIDPAPKHTVFVGEDGTRRVFIPARIYDNPYIDHDDYIRKLGALDPELKRALIEGDWDVVSGVRFNQWRENIHVIDPSTFPIPMVGAVKAVGVDYGLSAPFAALWGAKFSDDLVIVYREVGGPGYTPRQQAEMILNNEAEEERRPERPIPVALDPSTWARNPDRPIGPVVDKDNPPPGSIADAYRKVLGRQVTKARNDRIGGWSLIDEGLRVREDGLPRILVYNTCRELIRTLPAIARDRRNPEDVDTKGEDHYLDAFRYLMQELVGKERARKADPREQPSETITGSLYASNF